MSIYRGAGGAGDAVADSSSEALLVRQLAIEVQADTDAAAASATAAAGSASNASSSASAASTSASNAATSATNASNSASSASTSATNAANSATAAQTAETAAELAETNAETAETNAASSASAASSSASAASTSATNASNSASSASTSATNASNSASAASTSASNASTSATAASGSASSASTSASNASTSATNAASSASSASTSASTATTQAGIATTQASNASTSASNASTSATNASNSASTATTQASNASTSATNAATSATSSASSATDAAASAAAAAASYDSFDDRYLGSKSAAPTLDNDGNALVTGALYYNNGTVTPADKGMYVYDGTQWIAASAASTAILTVFKYTATAGQTTFTGADDNAVTLTYTAGSAIVTVNGAVMEIGTDVTASNGTSIVLAQAALVNDEVNIYAFATFNIANTYTQAQVDAGFLPKANPSYTGTLTGGTGVVNLGSGQFVKTAGGNVGIGNTIPASFDVFANQLVVGNGSSTQGITVYSGTTGAGALSFADGTSGSQSYQGYVYYNHNNNTMGFYADYDANTAPRMAINNTGIQTLKTISVGNVAPASTGAGITFPATQSASSDANTLDDYEEGTFTPSFTFGNGSTGITYSASRRIGTYTKIGNVVYYYIHVEMTNKGSSTGQFQITGLPFIVIGAENYVPGSVFLADMASITGNLQIRAVTGSTAMDAYQVVSSTYSLITNSNFLNNSGLQISGFYRTT